MTASELGTGSSYGQGCVEGKRGSLSDECNLQTSTGAWAHIRLAVGVCIVPSVPGTWHGLAIEVPFAGGELGRLVAPLRYQILDWVGRYSSRARRSKWLDENFLRYRMPTLLISRRSNPRI